MMKKYKILTFALFLLFSTSLAVANSPALTVTNLRYDPVPVEAGSYFDLWIQVENIAEESHADNLTCEIRPDYPFSLDDNQPTGASIGDDLYTRRIGRLAPQQEATLQYTVRTDIDAVEGWNSIPVACQSDQHDYWITREIEVKVDEGVNLGVGSISSEPLDVKADTDDVRLEISLENNGGADAKSVNTELELPEGFEQSNSYSLRDSVGRIDEGGAREAVFYIDVDETVDSGVYYGEMEVNHYSNNEEVVETFEIPLDVRPSPNLNVEDIRVYPEDLGQSDEAELRFNVRNKGEGADSISARMFTDSDQPIDFDENYDYIGDLDRDSSSEAVFRFTVDEDANLKEYLLDAEIRYIDGEEVKTETETVPVEVVTEMSLPFSEALLYAIPPLIVLVILVWIVVKFKRSRKEEEDEPEDSSE